MNTDGNLAALNQYEREQDALESADLKIEVMQHNLAIDLWEAYVTKNYAVIDEVDALLLDTDTTDNLINKLREAMTAECQRPVMGRGTLLCKVYEQLIDEVCKDIAGRHTTADEFEEARREFGL